MSSLPAPLPSDFRRRYETLPKAGWNAYAVLRGSAWRPSINAPIAELESIPIPILVAASVKNTSKTVPFAVTQIAYASPYCPMTMTS